MLDCAQYAKNIEDGLNEIISRLENRNIAEHYVFRVFPDLGLYQEAVRAKRSNRATVYVNCLLTSNPAQNDTIASGLIIGVDNFTLRVALPLYIMRTTIEESGESINDNIYTFVETMKGVVNEYFKVNTIESITDTDGNHYACGYSYTMARTGSVDMATIIGEYIDFEAYITVNVVQNGINSKDVVVEFDGEVVPYQLFAPNRNTLTEAGTYSDGTGASKAISSATTLAFTLTLPAVVGTITSQFNEYLLNGKLNTLHFVRLRLGGQEEYSKYYCMTYGEISASANGVLNVGLSIGFKELVYIPEIMTYPSYMTVKRVQSDGALSVRVTASKPCIVAMTGDYIVNFGAGETLTFSYGDGMMSYDDEDEKYNAYIVACPIDKSDAGANLITVEVI